MCMEIIIGSAQKLPVIKWDEESPGFYVTAIQDADVPEIARESLHSSFYYSPGSFMGCTCGFCYDQLSANDDMEDRSLRIRDVNDFMKYLNQQSHLCELKVLCFDWHPYPDTLLEQEFNPKNIDNEEFCFEENTILHVKAK